MSTLTPSITTFPPLNDETNPLHNVIDKSKTLLNNMHVNFFSERSKITQEKHDLIDGLAQQQEAVSLFEKQCYQSLKNLHIISKMLEPKFPSWNELQLTMSGLESQLTELRAQYIQLRDGFRVQSLCSNDSQSIVEEWDSARFLLCEVHNLFQILREKSPEMLHFYFNCEDIIQNDFKIRTQLGIQNSTPPLNPSLHRDVLLTPSKIHLHKRLSIVPPNDNNNDLYTTLTSSPSNLVPKTPTMFNKVFHDNNQQLSNEQIIPLTFDQIELFKLDTIEKRQTVVSMQNVTIDKFEQEYQGLQTTFNESSVQKQYKLVKIQQLKEKIAIRQLHLNNGSSASILPIPATTTTTTTTKNSTTTTSSKTPTHSTIKRSPSTTKGRRGSASSNHLKSTHGNKATMTTTAPSTKQATISTIMTRTNDLQSSPTSQHILKHLHLSLDNYKSYANQIQFFNHIEIDTQTLEEQHYITFRFKSMNLPNGCQTPVAKLTIFRNPPGSTHSLQQTPQSLVASTALTSIANEEQLVDPQEVINTGIQTAPPQSFIFSDAKLSLMGQDCTPQIQHLIQEAILVQNLGLFVIEVQSLLAETSL